MTGIPIAHRLLRDAIADELRVRYRMNAHDARSAGGAAAKVVAQRLALINETERRLAVVRRIAYQAEADGVPVTARLLLEAVHGEVE